MFGASARSGQTDRRPPVAVRLGRWGGSPATGCQALGVARRRRPERPFSRPARRGDVLACGEPGRARQGGPDRGAAAGKAALTCGGATDSAVVRGGPGPGQTAFVATGPPFIRQRTLQRQICTVSRGTNLGASACWAGSAVRSWPAPRRRPRSGDFPAARL